MSTSSAGLLRLALLPAMAVFAIAWFLGCSSSVREVQPSSPAASAHVFPTAALDLLVQSTTDSCASCARTHRREAFELLNDVYRPGTLLTSTPESTILRVAGDENLLTFTSYDRGEPTMTFRFHTTASHLVGIAEADLTDSTVVGRLRSAPEDALLQGTLQIVAYAYGDGASYLYSASSNHLEVQCKVLEISER